MLCRMIARAAQIPWRVPFSLSAVPIISCDSWVVGVHEKWTDALVLDARLVGLKRDRASHEDSLARFGMMYDDWLDIVQSLPDDLCVDYAALVSGDPAEIDKLENLTGVVGIKPEPRAAQYAGPFDWCR